MSTGQSARQIYPSTGLPYHTQPGTLGLWGCWKPSLLSAGRWHEATAQDAVSRTTALGCTRHNAQQQMPCTMGAHPPGPVSTHAKNNGMRRHNDAAEDCSSIQHTRQQHAASWGMPRPLRPCPQKQWTPCLQQYGIFHTLTTHVSTNCCKDAHTPEAMPMHPIINPCNTKDEVLSLSAHPAHLSTAEPHSWVGAKNSAA